MNDYSRVRYHKCPLIEVALQLNFPAILSIDTNEPAEFQEAIRLDFSNYKVSTSSESQLTIDMKNPAVQPVFSQKPGRKEYMFISEDGKWKISLSKSRLSISTLAYTVWEDMYGKFREPFEAFVRIYKPVFFQRAGLRYVDAFNKNSLNLAGINWKELIRPHLLGCLAYADESQVSASTVSSEFKLEEDVYVKVNSGLGGAIGSKDDMFILDCDYFYKKRINIEQMHEITQLLHRNSTKFVRDSITERLHEAMEPEELDSFFPEVRPCM